MNNLGTLLNININCISSYYNQKNKTKKTLQLEQNIKYDKMRWNLTIWLKIKIYFYLMQKIINKNQVINHAFHLSKVKQWEIYNKIINRQIIIISFNHHYHFKIAYKIKLILLINNKYKKIPYKRKVLLNL